MKKLLINPSILTAVLSLACVVVIGASNASAQDRSYLKREAAVKDNMKYARRLENIAGPVVMKNADNCGDVTAPYIGAQFATTDSVGENYQPVMENLYGTGLHPTVTMIAKQSPAAQNLQIGDMITAVNGIALTQGRDSLDEMSDYIYQSKNTPLTLSVQRDGAQKEIIVKPVTACDIPVRLVNQDAVEVFADGGKVAVTKAILKSDASDQQIGEFIEQELLEILKEITN